MTGIFGGGLFSEQGSQQNSSNKLPSLMRDTDKHHGDIDSAGRSRPYFLRFITTCNNEVMKDATTSAASAGPPT